MVVKEEMVVVVVAKSLPRDKRALLVLLLTAED
jgi:hypothetical protein